MIFLFLQVQLGEEYQADVEAGTSEYAPGERDNDGDKLLWKPDVVSAKQLETFLDIAYKLDDMNSQTTERDDEQVLFTLLQAKDVQVALKQRQEQVRKGEIRPVLSAGCCFYGQAGVAFMVRPVLFL